MYPPFISLDFVLFVAFHTIIIFNFFSDNNLNVTNVSKNCHFDPKLGSSCPCLSEWQQVLFTKSLGRLIELLNHQETAFIWDIFIMTKSLFH